MAAVRSEVRRLAAGVGDVRRTLWRTFGLLAGLGGLALALAGRVDGLCFWLFLVAFGAGFFAVMLAGLAGLLLGGCRAQLRRQLETLPTEQRREALLPLARYSEGDTLRIVEPLLRELSAARTRRTEVAPAAAAAGRGDEPSAAPPPAPDAPPGR